MAAKKKAGTSFAVIAAFYTAIFSAIIVAGSFEIIKVWPLPVSVVPMFGWKGGIIWGLAAGAISGLVIGFCTDDKHFDQPDDSAV